MVGVERIENGSGLLKSRHRTVSAAYGSRTLYMQKLREELLFVRLLHVRCDVGTADKDGTASRLLVAEQLPLHLLGESLVELQRMTVVALVAEYEVYDSTTGEVYTTPLHDALRATHHVILLGSCYGAGVLRHVVEVVACHEVTGHLVAAVAERACSFTPCRRRVEHLLHSAPSCRQPVGNTWVFIDVEALFEEGVADGGRGETVETVDHEHRRSIVAVPYGAELFCRETLAAIVDSSDAETVELVFLQCDTGTCGLHVYTVVIAARAHCHVDIIGCRRGSTLRLVTLGKPRQGGIAVLALLYLEVHRGERTDYRLLTMCRGLEAQYALVYGACYSELKVGVVRHAHVGETLMGECLEDS